MLPITVDETRPADGTKWTFDRSVTAAFEDMIRRSIPSHDDMRQLVYDLGRKFVQPNTDIIDLGCSRGAALAPFVDAFAGAGVRCVGLDNSGPMTDAARERFAAEINAGTVSIRHYDLRNGLPGLKPSLILAVLTLQFVAIEYRQRVIADSYRLLQPGGAMIVVEKCLGENATAQKLFVHEYHSLKQRHGYTADQVSAKAASLQGVLVPITPSANVELLEREGFRVCEFWRHLNFAGWLAVKPGEIN